MPFQAGVINLSSPVPRRRRGSSCLRTFFQLLETLSLGLSLRGRNGSIGVRVNETAALLVVLELSANTGTDSDVLAVVRAAALLAVGVRYAAASSELLALAISNIPGPRGVGGGNGKDGHGDCISDVS